MSSAITPFRCGGRCHGSVPGLLTAFAVVRLPGHGGYIPAAGLSAGGRPTRPIELPGILLAALATLGLGLVLGPEGPLIAVGLGLGAIAMRLVKKDAPDQAVGLMAAAGAFAAVSSIFGSPVIGAVLVIEATGLGGAALPVLLLPGFLPPASAPWSSSGWDRSRASALQPGR